jgi:cell division transport system permease protein
MNTIKLTVTARKNEISIMKYVGATDWFIRWPFLFEGILIGLMGAILSLAIGYVIYLQSVQAVMNYLGFLAQLFELREIGAVYIVLTNLILFMGIGIGALGSVVSVRRYLDV